jgi:hypothetical protein
VNYKIFLVINFLFLSGISFGQVERIPYYDNINFNNSFSLVAENDLKNNYIIVDLTYFKTEFEKAYFTRITFNENKLVRLDARNTKMAWFKADKAFSVSFITDLLLKLKNETLKISSVMNESQKQEWLTNNIK